MSMTTILVADDEDLLCNLYAEELTDDGYRVITTCDAAELMDMIKVYGPDLILLDIKMGKYNGLDLLQEIRNANYRMPVILCTAYSSFKYDLKSIAADDYVVKSADLTELKLKIKAAIERVQHFDGQGARAHKRRHFSSLITL